MNAFTRNTLILLLGLVLGVSLSITGGVIAERQPAVAEHLPLETVQALSEVFQRVKENYVEDVDDKTLLENAIRGMLTGLDPHSSYLDEKATTELRIGTSGEFGGLGIVVGMEDGFVKVVSPIDDTPAAKAGIQSGDLIIRLDDQSVKGMSLDDAVKLMRGKPGSKITLTVVREGEDKPMTFKLTRDKIRVESVKARLLGDGYGYVRISNFQMRTGSDLRKEVTRLKKENDGNLKGLVLDLRNNPGGLLDAAISVSDAFITEGDIVSIKGRTADNKKTARASPEDILKGAPIVVLINGGSASASEIVAGALQDHRRGVIMGSESFGKGSVQSVIDLQNNTAIKLTTALYYTPSMRSIQAEGIHPDIRLSDVTVAAREEGFKPLREADLGGHLMNGNGENEETDSEGQKNDKDDLSLASDDYPVFEALNLLKGLHLLKSQE
ncbi:MAG: S41 family peptidase [Thiohalophilus sp.]|uniref:S41 family peptidase n=1 Tax=Thiohalophilus sp. TaxID=3028392 RepID=UPI00287026E4|nr:S41 family peptidase [Thiohalophilus sp.]MDR9437314.1 S41 family peptidase [Thiohalophilus sp.]